MSVVSEEQARELLHTVGIWPPNVGERWTWEPDKPHAREDVTITAVTWNGENWWIETENLSNGKRCLNDWSRFMEACVMVAPADALSGMTRS
jgi:hypothetical protein